jgi:hypothetical protein
MLTPLARVSRPVLTRTGIETNLTRKRNKKDIYLRALAKGTGQETRASKGTEVKSG